MEEEFNEILFYTEDITVVEAEEFTYTKSVTLLDENGNPYNDVVDVTFSQSFSPIPEMQDGCYMTVFSNDEEATLVQDFMLLNDPSFQVVGNWSINGMQFNQPGISEFDPTVYEFFLDGVGVLTTSILDELPQVLLPSGWNDRDLVGATEVRLTGSVVTYQELDKKQDIILPLVVRAEETMVDPTVQIIIDLQKTKNGDSDTTIKYLINDVDSGYEMAFDIMDNEYTTWEETIILTGITLNPGDTLTFEYRGKKETDLFSMQFNARYLP